MCNPGEILVFAEREPSEYFDALSLRRFVTRCLDGVLRRLPRLPVTVEVDDLVQETLVVLWRRQQEDGQPFFRSYVAIAARTVAIDCLRHAAAKKRGKDLTTELSCDVREPGESVEDRLLADERLRVLLTRLRSAVPTRTFEAVRLRCIEGLSAKEMAPRLGMSESAINSALHRAKAAVRPKATSWQTAAKDDP